MSLPSGKESACNAGDPGSIPGLGRSTGEGKGYPLPYSGLENSMDCIVHGVPKSQTRLNDFHFHFQSHPKVPSYLPAHRIPLGRPRAPALGALLHAWNSK